MASGADIAKRTGIGDDLMAVFAGDRRKVDIVLTLAIFPYLTKFSFNRVEHWQRNVKSPCDFPLPLSPETITKLSQSITEKYRMALLSLRARRMDKGALCAVNSTTRTAWGGSLADIHWGKNKDHLLRRVSQRTDEEVRLKSARLSSSSRRKGVRQDLNVHQETGEDAGASKEKGGRSE